MTLKAQPSYNSFPYSEDGLSAPRTDGIVAGTNVNEATGSVYVPFPNGIVVGNLSPDQRGMVQDYLGNTKCVDTYTTGHPVLAGDF